MDSPRRHRGWYALYLLFLVPQTVLFVTVVLCGIIVHVCTFVGDAIIDYSDEWNNRLLDKTYGRHNL